MLDITCKSTKIPITLRKNTCVVNQQLGYLSTLLFDISWTVRSKRSLRWSGTFGEHETEMKKILSSVLRILTTPSDFISVTFCPAESKPSPARRMEEISILVDTANKLSVAESLSDLPANALSISLSALSCKSMTAWKC